MEWYSSLLIALGLAMDAFAVSLGAGTSGIASRPRPVFRLSFHMGLFQGLMTFLGWLAGITVYNLITSIDHWVAFGLLAFVGLRMIRSGVSAKPESQSSDISRGGNLVMVCVATSIDAMAVGLSLAMVGVQIAGPSLMIGVVTLCLSLIGLKAGSLLGEKFGKRMEVLGGLVLIGIGLRILYTHLFI